MFSFSFFGVSCLVVSCLACFVFLQRGVFVRGGGAAAEIGREVGGRVRGWSPGGKRSFKARCCTKKDRYQKCMLCSHTEFAKLEAGFEGCVAFGFDKALREHSTKALFVCCPGCYLPCFFFPRINGGIYRPSEAGLPFPLPLGLFVSLFFGMLCCTIILRSRFIVQSCPPS